MATAALVTELNSYISYEYGSSNQISNRSHKMAPLHIGDTTGKVTENKNSEKVFPSPTTSVESSSAEVRCPIEQDHVNSMVPYTANDCMVNNASKPKEEQEGPSPLERLQCSLEKHGILGQQLSNLKHQKESFINSEEMQASLEHAQYIRLNGSIYQCHLCKFTGENIQSLKEHMDSHFRHRCAKCNYTSRTEGRLLRHMKDFHSETPPESWAGNKNRRSESNDDQPMDEMASTGSIKSRISKCKHCDFVGTNKLEYYIHFKSTHQKSGKLLSCNQCPFVTEYKHHLEYHLRNHFGSKPFKCNKCNYSCVNKSMLNSHKKSHSNIYQYRCAGCSYATKYCHSLKLHLRKYNHQPGATLNSDGTPNSNPIIDVYGRRRGPKSKRRKISSGSDVYALPSVVTPSPPSNYSNNMALLSPGEGTVYPHPQFYNAYNMFMRSPIMDGSSNVMSPLPPFGVMNGNRFNCIYCEYSVDTIETYQQHMLAHVSRQNPELLKTYNDQIIHMQVKQLALSNFAQSMNHFAENSGISTNETHKVGSSMSEHSPAEYQEEKWEEQNSDNGKQSSVSPINVNGMSHVSVERDNRNEYRKIFNNFEALPSEKRSPPNEFSDNERHAALRSFLVTSPKEGRIEAPKAETNAHSPLDLSNTKPPTAFRNDDKSLDSSPESDIGLANIENRSAPSQYMSRNRRKGKAFKLEHYFQENSVVKDYSSGHSTDNDSVDDNMPTHQFTSREGLLTYDSTDLTTSLQFQSLAKENQDQIYDHKRNSSLTKKWENFTKNNSQSPQCPRDSAVNECSSTSPNFANKADSYIEDSENGGWPTAFTCANCEMAFRDLTMYTIHMGLHVRGEPFMCNKCGQQCEDKVKFFLHLVHTEHK